MPKFFVQREDIAPEGLVCIRGGDAVHISKVRRLGPGDAVLLCDGEGMDYSAVIRSIGKDEVVLAITGSSLCRAEPTTEVTLFQGLPKQGKMESIIEKCTELGIARVVPVAMKRSVVKLAGGAAEEKKLARWQKVAAEAVKQCGRGKIPAVARPMSMPDAIKEASHLALAILPYERERSISLRQVLRQNQGVRSLGLFIGPEGGFEEEEVMAAQEAGIFLVSLGARILRTETAGHSALSAVMYEFGEWEFPQ